MQLTNWEFNPFLTWSENCVLSDAVNQEATFTIKDTKMYVPLVSLLALDNAKLLRQWK